MKIINTEHFAIQRKIVACKTSESWQNVPHVCYNYEPEVSAFYDTYKKVFSSRCVENKITFNTLMLKVITEGLKQAPVMNSHITYNHRFLRGRISRTVPLPSEARSAITLSPTSGLEPSIRNFPLARHVMGPSAVST